MNFQWILHEKSFNCCDWNSRQKYSIYDTNTLCIHNIIYLCIHYCYWKSNIPMNPPFRLFIGLFVGWKTFQEIFLGKIYTICGNFLKGNIEKLRKPMFESLLRKPVRHIYKLWKNSELCLQPLEIFHREQFLTFIGNKNFPWICLLKPKEPYSNLEETN